MTPIKTVRLPADLRAAIAAEARRQGTNESAIIRQVLRKALRPAVNPNITARRMPGKEKNK